MSRLRNFCFTTNKYTDIDVENAKNVPHSYVVFGYGTLSRPGKRCDLEEIY
jgi:hypothetical protein